MESELYIIKKNHLLALQKASNSMRKSARKLNAIIKNIRVENLQETSIVDDGMLGDMKEIITGKNIRKDILNLFDKDNKTLTLPKMVNYLEKKHVGRDIRNKVKILVENGELWNTETGVYGRTT